MNGFESKEAAREKFVEANPHLKEKLQKILNSKRELEKKAREEKWEKMMQMRRDGRTLKEVGLEFGVTRERVRQIIALRMEDYAESKLTSRKVHRKALTYSICDSCGDPYIIPWHKKKNNLCSSFCWHKAQGHTTGLSRLPVEEKRKIWNEKTKKYYREVLRLDPVYKAKEKKRNKAAYQKKREKASKDN